MGFFDKIKAGWAFLRGDVISIIEFGVDIVNTQFLSKIPNKEVGVMYLKDVQALTSAVGAILDNHASQMSQEKKVAGDALIDALNELAKALEDFNISPDECTMLVDKIKAAIEAFKAA